MISHQSSSDSYPLSDALTLDDIANARDTLADSMVSDGMEDLAGGNASFWRDAAAVLRARARVGGFQDAARGVGLFAR